jgi:hypothetical protein
LTKDDLVQLAVTFGVYDNRCKRLAPRLLADVQRMVQLLDKDDLLAGVIKEQDKVDRAGEAQWCDALRPVVENFKDGLFEPTTPR